MPARWSPDSVRALAPDASSLRAATALAGPSSWTGAGTADGLVWGLCAGSGRAPYQTIVDLDGPVCKCSCPSRKFPCKHALALLLTWAGGLVPDEGEPAGYAREWQSSRGARAAKPRVGQDLAAAARRSQQRAGRVTAGLAELQTWLRDQIRAGLSATPAAGHGFGHADLIAARMVDAQAPGVASVLRRLSVVPVSGDGWPGRLLAEYAQLHLLARAYDQLDTLPAGLRAVVRSRVGYTGAREDVLATEPVTDRWQVLATRDLPDEHIPARRIWLRGRATGRDALLLSFAVQGDFSGQRDAGLMPGTELHADLHYYPGQPSLRAATGTRHAEPGPSGCPPAAGAGPLLDQWAAALEQDPWLTEWPAVLAGTPMAGPGQWHLSDSGGLALPLLGGDRLWPLLAISGGHPVTVAGEWSPAGLTALTVWQDGVAVPL